MKLKYNFQIKEELENGYLLVNESGEKEISKDDLKHYIIDEEEKKRTKR